MIDEIDNGNTIINNNIDRLEATLDGRNTRRRLASTAKALERIGSFINSICGTNEALSQRAENIGSKLLDEIANEAGIDESKNN